MNRRLLGSALAAELLLSLSSGCATKPKLVIGQQTGESIVLVGQQPASLAHLPLRNQPVRLRSAYLPGPGMTEYIEGHDLTIDYAEGTVRRTPTSRAPDFQTNMLFGKDQFDHNQFPGFGNNGFFVFADYSYVVTERWPEQLPQVGLLKASRAKLVGGQPLKIVAFGDSITAGGDATRPELIFWQRWANDLQRKYPAARVTAVNGATGGDATPQGLARLEAKVLAEKPDLVLIGFGMNDHNLGGVPIPDFENNLKQLISRIRASNGAEIVLCSAFPPNPKWKYGSHRMQEYADATQRVAQETGCAFANVYRNWQALVARKKPEDLLGNNINHPNDFGHWVYFRVLQEMGL